MIRKSSTSARVTTYLNDISDDPCPIKPRNHKMKSCRKPPVSPPKRSMRSWSTRRQWRSHLHSSCERVDFSSLVRIIGQRSKQTPICFSGLSGMRVLSLPNHATTGLKTCVQNSSYDISHANSNTSGIFPSMRCCLGSHFNAHTFCDLQGILQPAGLEALDEPAYVL